ncbi:kynureninase [Microlunatus flavus]|uniref:Kynureninase n=1 Tax=Microlunatus flavus TaxID=1036181 RepID=A0A1H9KJ61_9ACTN|nr:kynureninase [Microlunatus flavus]SEQ99190.1 kynureninase [Microlunatus flavus]
MTSREDCDRRDAQDALAAFRDEFVLPEGVVYLDGNSLGARPRAAAARAAQVVEEEWGQDLIGSWNTAGWWELPGRLGDRLAPLIGGAPGTTLVTDTTTGNLFKALAAALSIQAERAPGRRVIVSERDNFPTDLYVAAGLAELLGRGHELRLLDSPDALDAALADGPAVVTLSHVNYRTGALWDLADVTARVHAAGALVVWDLAHSVGALPIDLTGADADLAVGCTYKYLNGGPGSPAFLWVHPRHAGSGTSALPGWWGHARPFAMEPTFEPATGVARFLAGTQPVVSLALVECGLEIAARADLAAVRAKSLALGDLFLDLVEQRCGDHPLRLVTPREHDRRGSHLTLAHPDAYAVVQALIARGVVGDYREPDCMRFGLTPLYLRFVDVWDAVDVLADVLDSRAYAEPRFRERSTVT